MNSIVKWLLIPILVAFTCCTPKPAVRNQTETPVPSPAVVKNQIAVDLKVIGVGYDSELAESDSTSTYYAVKRGVQFQYVGGNVRLRLNNTNEGAAPVENLAKAKMVRLDNGFFVYEYPYNGNLELPKPYKKTVITVNITKPFSYLSRMFVKCLSEEYNGVQGNHSGYLYLTGLSYQLLLDQSLKVQAEILIMEDPEVRFK